MEHLEIDLELMDPETEFPGLWNDKNEEIPPSQLPKASWPEVKAQLNEWGDIFATGDETQRLKAIDRIMELFGLVTFSYKNLDTSSQSNSRYKHAVAIMQTHFIGETSHPIRFLKGIYPEDVFFNAIMYTFGYDLDKKDDAPQTQCAYDPAKGTQYVTYFAKALQIFCSRRRDQLNKKFHADLKLQGKMLDYEEDNRNAAALIDLAMLTADKLLLDEKLPIGDEQKGKAKTLSAKNLQLFYSFHLVNFSRFATNALSNREDRILMDASDTGFLTFSTAIQTLTYRSLIHARLSDFVLQNKYYKEVAGQKLLQDRVAACYRNMDKGDLSKLFQAARRYLRCHWNYENLI